MVKTEKIELRKNILKLHRKGKTQMEISHLLDVPQTTISFWVRRCSESSDFEDKKRPGKTPKLNAEQMTHLKLALLDSPPLRYGGESMGWLTKVAIKFVEDKFGVKYSMRRMEELFHKLGLSLITPRSEHKKASYAARAVYRADFKKNSKTNIWIAPSLISTK